MGPAQRIKAEGLISNNKNSNEYLNKNETMIGSVIKNNILALSFGEQTNDYTSGIENTGICGTPNYLSSGWNKFKNGGYIPAEF